ncbi:MAG: amino acid adenylation domain-containing protein [Pseudomonadales bacterium]|nr:amino acid adenylation domain-containing protein [Pseudomonadales bacterium]
MNTAELKDFLHNLWIQGVELWLENGQLRFRGSKSVMDSATLATLKQHKQATIALLEAAPKAYSGFALSHGQQAIHLMQHMAPDSHAYNQVCFVKLQTNLKPKTLKNAVADLIDHQPSLQTGLSRDDGQVKQLAKFSVNDIFNCEEQTLSTEDEIQQWLDNKANTPFMLEQDALIRITLLNNSNDNYLLIVAHHIIADFWAMDLIIKELQSFYQAQVSGQAAPLNKLTKNFKDYVLSERQWLNSEAGLAAKDYWHSQLTPLPNTLELPTDFIRPARQSYQGREYPFTLDKTLTQTLKQQAKKHQVTPFVWVLSAYQTLLHRYTGERHITVGSPVAGRLQSEMQKIAGHFTNPVTLNHHFSAEQRFVDLLGSNKPQLLNALKHQLYPFQCLIEELQPQRDANSSPIFQVAISWNQLEDTDHTENGLIEEVKTLEQRGAIYDLVLTCFDKGDEIGFSWRYNRDLFKEETIKRLCQHLNNILSQSCEKPQQLIQDFDFRTAAEIELVKNINKTAAPLPKDVNLAKIFQQIAQQQPQLAAFSRDDGIQTHTTSYQELDQYSNQLANHLSATGINPGQTLALCMNRSLDMLACILACLKMGCIYIPIDPIYPKERIGQILQQSGAGTVISHSRDARKIRFVSDKNVLEIDQQQELIRDLSTDFPLYKHGDVAEDTIACILFTSGSTGTPKGVQIPHRAIKRLAINNGFFEVEPGDTFCYVSNVSFDATNIEIWGSLLNGGNLLYVATDTILDPHAFADFIVKHKPHASVITTALFNVLINYKADIFKGFKSILVGGEALDVNLMRQCCENGKPKNLVNIYGPTENGTVSTVFEMADLQADDISVPIGRPNNNSQVYIHDNVGNQCPVGIIGELVVGGEGVATGYLNQTQLSHERFSDDFYRGKGLLYATGDMGFLREDGQIIYTGRKDDQVKVRGYRIELGEIEQQLSQHERIANCSVIAVKSTSGSSHLAAYYTSTETVSPAEIKQYLKQQLPDFMVPSALMQLDKLPINANGKVDKKHLPDISFERHHDYIAPRDTTEIAIADIWMQQLGITQLGIHDNFFELGGHSLLAVNTASEMKTQLQLDVNMRLIFENPSIAELSTALNQENQQQLPAITAYTATQEPIQAAMAQQRLWFLQQLNPTSCAYNMPVAIRLNMPFKASVMELMLKQLIIRHQSLRTSFTDDNGIAYLSINSCDDWSLPTLDFSQLNKDEAEAQAQIQINQLACHAFDLSQGPLIKAVMIHLSADEHILALCLHHIISDGWSVEVLLAELGQLWTRISAQLNTPQNKPLILPELPAHSVQYTDYSLWQRQWLQGEVLDEQLNYWKNKLAGAPALLNLPTDKTRPAQLSNEGGVYTFTIETRLLNQLRQLSQDNSATLFMTMLAAYSLLLARYTQQSDICVGFPISGRNQHEVEPLIGLFVNNLVARTDLSQNPTVNQYIQQVRQTTIEAYAHQDAPFDRIIDALKLERSLSYTPLLQASFALENQSIEDKIEAALGQHAKLEPLDWNIAKYDINLSCFDRGDEIQANLEYSSDLYHHDTIKRMADHFLRLLQKMVKNADLPVNELRLLTFDERRIMIEQWQQQASHNKLTINCVNRFEIQAAKFSHNTAITFEQQVMDYQTLNLKANQLAHYLCANGIQAGDYIGLYLERSCELIIAILAILKTGAAYIPLDPHAPKDRINFILKDANVKHVISSQNLAEDIEVKNIFAVDKLQSTLASLPTDNLNIYIPNDSIAYIIYTSGTTGKPKGCLVSHANLARLFTATDKQFNFTEDDVWTLFHSYAFDFSVWEIWGALLYGGKLSIIPQWMTRVPDAFYQHLIDEKVTILNQTPSAFSQLISIDAQSESKLLSLRKVIFGGEALDFNALQQWISKHTLEDIMLINMYGITETTVHVSYHEISHEDIQRGRSIIGKPLNDLLIHILDSHGQLAPTGILGEMFISGAGVTQGYLNREELTRERFLDNPFIQDIPVEAATAHKRMYRSGDLARRLASGDIEYLGRIDHQVKIRGYRIELGEIESALSQQDKIKESIVLAREEEAGQKRLVAYLLVEDETAMELDDIRRELRTLLPEYMIPAAFVTLTQWPLTANGKVDKMRLPAPQSNHFSSKEYIAPRNDSEQSICLIWSEVLDIEKVGIHDNFFELGGHSLLATQVASRIRAALHCTLELKSIFENPTPAELALVIIEEEIGALDLDDDDLLALLSELED